MAFAKKPAPPPPSPHYATTTAAPKDTGIELPDTRAAELPPTEIQLLSDDLVAVCKTATYDDMSWPEIDAALMLASHKVKIIIGQHGTLDPSPGDNVQAARA